MTDAATASSQGKNTRGLIDAESISQATRPARWGNGRMPLPVSTPVQPAPRDTPRHHAKGYFRGNCYKCHLPGHIARDCPDKKKAKQLNGGEGSRSESTADPPAAKGGRGTRDHRNQTKPAPHQSQQYQYQAHLDRVVKQANALREKALKKEQQDVPSSTIESELDQREVLSSIWDMEHPLSIQDCSEGHHISEKALNPHKSKDWTMYVLDIEIAWYYTRIQRKFKEIADKHGNMAVLTCARDKSNGVQDYKDQLNRVCDEQERIENEEKKCTGHCYSEICSSSDSDDEEESGICSESGSNHTATSATESNEYMIALRNQARLEAYSRIRRKAPHLYLDSIANCERTCCRGRSFAYRYRERARHISYYIPKQSVEDMIRDWVQETRVAEPPEQNKRLPKASGVGERRW